MSNLRGHIISTVRLYPDMIVSLLSAEATDDEVLHRSKEPASCARGEFGRQPYGMETVHCLNSLHIPPCLPSRSPQRPSAPSGCTRCFPRRNRPHP